jgi:membrane protein implicated in regulation of membrane protease activity
VNRTRSSILKAAAVSPKTVTQALTLLRALSVRVAAVVAVVVVVEPPAAALPVVLLAAAAVDVAAVVLLRQAVLRSSKKISHNKAQKAQKGTAKFPFVLFVPCCG